MIKGLEALGIIKLRLSNNATNKLMLNIIGKELKTLEIIKREPSMVGWQAGYEDYEDYLDNTPEEQRFIKNKEEFDLLKEVLL